MQYEQVWDAVDKLARLHGLSPSGLAKKAGLDATTFNKSKRTRRDGKQRWPSLDSINKILDACNISFEQFYQLIDEDLATQAEGIPFIRFSELEKNGIKNSKLVTDKWEKIQFPDTTVNLYAVNLDTADFEPIFRKGNTLIATKDPEIRKGDRVLIFLIEGAPDIKEFRHRTTSTLVFGDLMSPNHEVQINISDIKLINRIVWAEQ